MNKLGILSTILLLVLGLSVFAYVDYGEGSAQQYGSQGTYLGGAQGNFKGYYVLGSGMTALTGDAVADVTGYVAKNGVCTYSSTKEQGNCNTGLICKRTGTTKYGACVTKTTTASNTKTLSSGTQTIPLFLFGEKGLKVSAITKGDTTTLTITGKTNDFSWVGLNTVRGTYTFDNLNGKLTSQFNVGGLFDGGGLSSKFRTQMGLPDTGYESPTSGVTTPSGTGVNVAGKPNVIVGQPGEQSDTKSGTKTAASVGGITTTPGQGGKAGGITSEKSGTKTAASVGGITTTPGQGGKAGGTSFDEKANAAFQSSQGAAMKSKLRIGFAEDDPTPDSDPEGWANEACKKLGCFVSTTGSSFGLKTGSNSDIDPDQDPEGWANEACKKLGCLSGQASSFGAAFKNSKTTTFSSSKTGISDEAGNPPEPGTGGGPTTGKVGSMK